jgi:hypothetical protein
LGLFLSPTLKECFLHEYLPLVHSDLKSIATRCPVLESLSIWSKVVDINQLSLLSDSIRSCERLKHLTCPELDYAAWKHLSKLPTLVTVRITWWLSKVMSDLDHVNFAPFLNVTTLHLRVNLAADIITLIQHSQFPSLKEFHMCVDDLPWAEAAQLFYALSRCKETLEGITISARESIGHSLTAIRHLFCFTQLRNLKLDVDFPTILLDNHLLLEAMSSWPHMRHLAFGDPYLDDHPPATVTFRGLFAALRRCPHLHTLVLSIDAVNIDVDPEVESFQHTSLRCLDVSDSDITDPEAVARIIFSMLPYIEDGVDFDNAGDSRAKLWYEVNDFLDVFAARDRRIELGAPTT